MTDKPQFDGLPMGDLIGGPLTAASDAQVRLANATADFIKLIGGQPAAGPAAPTDHGATDRRAGEPQIDPRARLINPKIEIRGPGAPNLSFGPTPPPGEAED